MLQKIETPHFRRLKALAQAAQEPNENVCYADAIFPKIVAGRKATRGWGEKRKCCATKNAMTPLHRRETPTSFSAIAWAPRRSHKTWMRTLERSAGCFRNLKARTGNTTVCVSSKLDNSMRADLALQRIEPRTFARQHYFFISKALFLCCNCRLLIVCSFYEAPFWRLSHWTEASV